MPIEQQLCASQESNINYVAVPNVTSVDHACIISARDSGASAHILWQLLPVPAAEERALAPRTTVVTLRPAKRRSEQAISDTFAALVVEPRSQAKG